MTAAAENPFHSSPVPELPPDTTPAAIREALIDEERDQLDKADAIIRTGTNPDARSLDDMQALINERLGR